MAQAIGIQGGKRKRASGGQRVLHPLQSHHRLHGALRKPHHNAAAPQAIQPLHDREFKSVFVKLSSQESIGF